MKKFLMFFVTFVIAVIITSPAFTVSPGNNAPRIILYDSNGAMFNSYNYKNKKNLIVSFFLVPCPPCIREIPHIQKIQNKYSHIKAILISDYKTNSKSAKAFLNSIEQKSGVKIKLPVVFDKFGDATRSFRVRKHPTTFLIDKKGKIIMRIDGFTEEKGEQLEEKVQSLIAK